MRYLQVLVICLMLCKSTQAQTTFITSEQRQVCYWDSTIQKFNICNPQEDFQCMFTLNAAQTMFVHTTASMRSTYYVQSKEYIADGDSYNYSVTSDVGNKYSFIIPVNAENFVILSIGHPSVSEDYIMKFAIKKKWNE